MTRYSLWGGEDGIETLLKISVHTLNGMANIEVEVLIQLVGHQRPRRRRRPDPVYDSSLGQRAYGGVDRRANVVEKVSHLSTTFSRMFEPI